MSTAKLNMRVLKPSRKRLRPGDVFTFQMPDDLFRYGRLVRTDAIAGGIPDCLLYYIYNKTSAARVPIPNLTLSDLLMPPLMGDRRPWTLGHFQNVAHFPLADGDVLPNHCFWRVMFRKYVDEYGNALSQRHEPCGLYCAYGYGAIDREISKALGFRFPPLDPVDLFPRSKQFYKNRLAELLEQGLSQKAAELKAMQDTVVQMGERVEDYAWPELPNQEPQKRK